MRQAERYRMRIGQMAGHDRSRHRSRTPSPAHAAAISALVLVAIAVLRISSNVGGPGQGTVTRVYDGDTVAIESTGRQSRCRLLGIDAPEMSYSGLSEEMDKVLKYAPEEGRSELAASKEAFEKWAGVMEAQAQRARDELDKMVHGKRVRLAYDTNEPRKDRYGRLLVYVSVDGTDVSAEMIKRGLAVADTRFQCERLDDYVTLQHEAEAAQVGMWAVETVDE